MKTIYSISLKTQYWHLRRRPPKDQTTRAPGRRGGHDDLVRPGIYDYAAGNQMYSDLVESLGLADKTDEQMFSEHVEANRRFYLKTTRAGRAQSGSGDQCELEYDRQLKIINWYFPPQIDKTEVIFHHLWLQEPPEQITYERCVDLSKDFTKLWRIADLKESSETFEAQAKRPPSGVHWGVY